MSEQRPRVIAVGEAIVEFVRGGDGRFGIGCAGDTFNVAVYLARTGIDAAFATALGDDPYSEAILARGGGRRQRPRAASARPPPRPCGGRHR
jgi:2-dehydro-3-deoxygluconokinase